MIASSGNNAHRIRRMSCEMAYRQFTQGEAFSALRAEMDSFLSTALPELLETVFEQHSRSGQIFYLKKLHLDIPLSYSGDSAELKQQLLDECRKQLVEALSRLSAEEALEAMVEQRSSNGQSSWLVGKRAGRQQIEIEALLFYLRYGFLTWKHHPYRPRMSAILAGAISQGALLEEIRQLTRRNPHIIPRLIKLLQAQSDARVFSWASEGQGEELFSFWNTVSSQLSSDVSGNGVEDGLAGRDDFSALFSSIGPDINIPAVMRQVIFTALFSIDHKRLTSSQLLGRLVNMLADRLDVEEASIWQWMNHRFVVLPHGSPTRQVGRRGARRDSTATGQTDKTAANKTTSDKTAADSSSGSRDERETVDDRVAIEDRVAIDDRETAEDRAAMKGNAAGENRNAGGDCATVENGALPLDVAVPISASTIEYVAEPFADTIRARSRDQRPIAGVAERDQAAHSGGRRPPAEGAQISSDLKGGTFLATGETSGELTDERVSFDSLVDILSHCEQWLLQPAVLIQKQLVTLVQQRGELWQLSSQLSTPQYLRLLHKLRGDDYPSLVAVSALVVDIVMAVMVDGTQDLLKAAVERATEGAIGSAMDRSIDSSIDGVTNESIVSVSASSVMPPAQLQQSLMHYLTLALWVIPGRSLEQAGQLYLACQYLFEELSGEQGLDLRQSRRRRFTSARSRLAESYSVINNTVTNNTVTINSVANNTSSNSPAEESFVEKSFVGKSPDKNCLDENTADRLSDEASRFSSDSNRLGGAAGDVPGGVKSIAQVERGAINEEPQQHPYAQHTDKMVNAAEQRPAIDPQRGGEAQADSNPQVHSDTEASVSAQKNSGPTSHLPISTLADGGVRGTAIGETRSADRLPLTAPRLLTAAEQQLWQQRLLAVVTRWQRQESAAAQLISHRGQAGESESAIGGEPNADANRISPYGRPGSQSKTVRSDAAGQLHGVKQSKAAPTLLARLVKNSRAVLQRIRQASLSGSALSLETVEIKDDPARRRQVEEQRLPTMELDEPIPVSNAGLVLIAAYLDRLFSALGWVENGNFIDPASAQKGVVMLGYIASGRSDLSELDLTLNKLLCGLPIDAFVEGDIELEESARATADSMLNAVISYWTALGSTSIDGLRGSFLLRGGWLRRNEDHWLLTVESKPYDMLLDQLPWSYSLVKLGWMGKPLMTEWRDKP